ncbi:MAG: hypothetical protein ACXU82_13155 [Caulobacteraceae bacterium]
MARFSPTDAVFAGFRFARERPAALLVWAGYLLVVIAVASVAMVDIGGDSLRALGIAARGANPDPQQLIKLTSDALPATMFAFLLTVVFGAILSAAILRVRMSPGPHPWGGLRLGGEELRLLGAKLLVLAAAFVVEVVISVFAAALEGVGVPALATMTAGLVLLMAPLMIRLSLAGVVSQAEGRLNPARSFQLTGPLFWRLLGAYVLLGAIMLVVLVLVTIIFTALIGAAALGGGGDMDQMAMALLQGRFADLNPLVVTIYVVWSLVRVWVAVVTTVVFLSISVAAYDAALREQH